MRRLSAAVLPCFAVLLSFSAAALAQTGSGQVTGVVQDASKGIIPGVTVVLTNTATGVSSTQLTNEAGVFAFPGIPPGAYSVSASLPGFKTSVANDVQVSQTAVRVNLTLEVGQLDAKVEVTAAADAVLTEAGASVGTNLSQRRVEDLPLVGQNVLDLLSVLPGFRSTPGADAQSTVGGLNLDYVNTTINGRTEATTADYYKFAAKKGQRILVNALGRTIDSRMAPTLVLFAGPGAEVARNRRGGLLDYTAAEDGGLVLKVHDFTYRGGAEYAYRVTISDGPHIDYVFPPSAVAGTKSKVTVFGRNLPGGSPAKGIVVDGRELQKIEVEITAPSDALAAQRLATGLPLPTSAATVDGFEYRLTTPQGISNPVLIGLAAAPVVVEAEPNNKPAEAQKITPPCEIAGRFFPAGDVDYYTFDAKKGDAFAVELFSSRLGTPSDASVVIQKVTKDEKTGEKVSDVVELADSPANVGGPEFNTASHDPIGRFEAKEDGTYRIRVVDLFNRADANAGLSYRLALRKEAPAFRLVALPEASQVKKAATDVMLWSASLRRGETIPIRLVAIRTDGFKDDINVSVEGLPKGVTFTETRIPASSNSVNLLLTADDSAAAWAGTYRIIGKAKVGDTLSFVNDDYENHWVYVPTFGHQISRAGIKPGESWNVELQRPGTFIVNCGLHSKMTTTVTVER